MAKSKSKTPKISREQLKQFRAQVRALRDAGKLPGKKVDLRKVTPTTRRGGKPLSELVKTKSRKSNLKPLRSPISVKDFPVKHKSLAGVLRDLEDNAAEIDKLKKPDEKWAFEIDGIRSYAVFYNINQLAQYLGESAGIQQVLKKRQESQELFSSLKLVRWNKSATEWKPGPQKRKPSHATRQAKSRARKKTK